jgi:AraC-like DNA-binding protein
LRVQVDDAPVFYTKLHCHSEYQITAIVSGEGVFYAGNGITSFSENDVLLIGSNVPHVLKSSISETKNQPLAKGVSLFFDDLSFGPQFFELKEMSNIKSLLHDSNRVIQITGSAKAEIYELIISTTSSNDEQLIITFLKILSHISKAPKKYLNNVHHNIDLNESENSRLNTVLAYTFQNMYQEMSIEQIAKIAFLSRSQFSHFFKLHTGKTYIQFLNELRIENACVLLRKSNETIEQICYGVGFQNVSNFVRHFKKVKTVTPSKYRKSWMP